MIKAEVSELLNKQMDRKDFLKHVGIGLVAAIGLSSFLRAVTQSSHSSSTKSTSGYGGSAYGGNK